MGYYEEMDPVATPPPSPSMNIGSENTMIQKKRRSLLLPIVIVLACLAAAFFFLSTMASDTLPPGTQVRFSSTGTSKLYELTHATLSHVISVPGFENALHVVTEALPTSPTHDTFVIARVAAAQGTAFGIIHADGSFTQLRAGGTEKSDLTAASDGRIFFSETLVPPQGTSSQAVGSVKNTSDVAITADAETASASTTLIYREGIDPAPSLFVGSTTIPTMFSRYSIVAFDPTHPTDAFSYIGSGRDPHSVADGSVIALAPEGLVHINPTTGERRVLISRAGADAAGSTLSQDGSRVALVSSDGSISFYSIDLSQTSIPFAYLGLAPNVGSIADATFVTTTNFLVRHPDGTAVLYRMPTASHPVASVRMKLLVVE